MIQNPRAVSAPADPELYRLGIRLGQLDERFRPNGDVLLTTGLSAATRLVSLGMPEAAMMLRADPKYPTRRTYVLKLHSDATPDVLLGRLENLVTCRQSDFTSARELLEFIAHDIASRGAEPSDNS